jgi:hypothetical protein
MLALTDAGLAHLVISASAVAPAQRSNWLHRVAALAEGRPVAPPKRSTLRKRRERERQRNGSISVKFELNEHDLAAVLVAAEWVTEGESLSRSELARGLQAAVREWLDMWKEHQARKRAFSNSGGS